MKELTAAKLISFRQNGRSLVYSVNFAAMRSLDEFLYQHCCGIGVTGCGPECIPDIPLTLSKTRVSRVGKRR